MTFVLSQDKVAYNQRVSVISAGVSIGCCLLVLVLSLWVWSVRSARGFLHRVSFRLLLWSMFFELIYDINYIAVVESASPTVINGRLDSAANARCATGIFFMIGTMGVVNYLCTAIAVNLAITIVLGLNPIVLKLERWYVGVSLFVGFFVPIVPAALGHFGFDPIFLVCWIQADNQHQRMINFVLDVYLWQLLSCLIATICVAATLIKLFRQGRATSRALFEGNSINLEFSDSSWDLQEKEAPRSLVSRIFHRRRHSHDKTNRFGHLEDRFIRIALRISLYPISLIIVNGIIAIGDIYISSQGGVHSKTVYGLYRIYYFLYGARGIFFAMLGLFVDPCLPRGLKAAWKATFPRDHPPTSHTVEGKAQIVSSGHGCLTPNGTRIDPLAASTVTQGDATESPLNTCLDPKNNLERQTSESSMDMLHALLMSGPPQDHDHWTHEWHSASMTGHDPMDESLRDSRHQRRSHSLPVFSVRRFLRRGSRKAMSAKSGVSDDQTQTEMDGSRFVEPIPEVELSPTSGTPPLPQLSSPSPLPSPSPKPTPPAEGFTMTFHGVAALDLPEGFDDHAHDVVHPEALEAAQAEAAAAEAAAAQAAAAALALPRRASTAGSRTPGNRTPAVPSIASGATTPTSPNFGFLNIRRPSLTSSLGSNFPPRRGSVADTGRSPSEREPSATRANASLRSGRIPPQRRATTQVAPRGSMDTSSLMPIEERRQRRERALEIAERLYEEMEAQL